MKVLIRKLSNQAYVLFGSHGLWIPLAAAFLLVNLLRIDDGGTNANARFATLRAMSDEHSFRIDNYHDWTMDWARTPDGHYYSNKAPGPTLIAFPVFWVIDTLLHPLQSKYPDEQGRRQAPRGIHKVAISTLFQVLPFLALVLISLQTAYTKAIPGYSWALLAILFGNTAAILMNSYMGDPFAAVAMMGIALSYLQKRPAWMSFYFGWLVLAQYPAAILVVPFAFLLLSELTEQGAKTLAKAVVKGAFVPALLWCWYHTVCFGSPFSLPFQYEISALAGKVDEGTGSIWGGIASLSPNANYAYELLLGSTRGLLFTQPWLLLVLIFGFWQWRALDNIRLRRLFIFAGSSLFLLLWLNAGFPGWHGGGSPGPRYLAAVLPLFGIFIPALYKRLPMAARTVLIASIFASLILRALIFATWTLAPQEPLWPYYWQAIKSAKEWWMLLEFTVLLGAALGASFLWQLPQKRASQQ